MEDELTFEVFPQLGELVHPPEHLGVCGFIAVRRLREDKLIFFF